jgi:hypothetical protein
VADDDDVIHSEVVFGPDVRHERIGVFDERRDALTGSALAGGSSMTARVPRKHRDIVEIQCVDDVLPASTVFVTSMKKDDGFARDAIATTIDREPRAVRQLDPIP